MRERVQDVQVAVFLDSRDFSGAGNVCMVLTGGMVVRRN
jgi:hypothetical protein